MVGKFGAKVGGINDQHMRVREEFAGRSGRRKSDRFIFSEGEMTLRG